MKKSVKNALLLFCLSLTVFSGCSKNQNGTPPEKPSVPIEKLEPIVLEDYLSKSPLKTSTDPALLGELWEGYIYPSVMNITNSLKDFESVSEIDPLDVARYLNYQIQRLGIMNANNFSEDEALSYGVPLKTLEGFSEKYFNVKINFRNYPNENEMYVDESTGICHFYPNGTYDSLTKVSYNNLESWPNFILGSVDIYDDNIYIANCAQQTYQGIDGELYRWKLVFKKRDDGSFYFVMGKGRYPQTNKVHMDGSYDDIGFYTELDKVILGVDNTDDVIIQSANTLTSKTYQRKNLKTGKLLGETTINHSANNPVKMISVFGDKLMAVSDDSISIYDLYLNKISVEPLPKKLMDSIKPLNDYDSYTSIVFSADLNNIALIDAEGIKLYNYKKNSVMLVPESAPKISLYEVENEGYKEVRFVDASTKLWASRIGYEWRVGYLLYDILDNSSTYYPYGGGYDTGAIITDKQAWLYEHNRIGQNADPVNLAINFSSKKETILGDSHKGHMGIYDEQGTRYILKVEEKLLSNRMAESKFYILDTFDSDNMEFKALDFKLTAPASSSTKLYVSKAGEIYLSVVYLDEKYTVIVR